MGLHQEGSSPPTPTWSGEENPCWDPNAKAAPFGRRRGTRARELSEGKGPPNHELMSLASRIREGFLNSPPPPLSPFSLQASDGLLGGRLTPPPPDFREKGLHRGFNLQHIQKSFIVRQEIKVSRTLPPPPYREAEMDILPLD